MKAPFHPQTLESSSTSILFALSETEVGKVILPNHLVFVEVHTGKLVDFLNDPPKFEKEMAALRYANAINDLMPKFIRKQLWQTEGGEKLDMLVMERLYPLPISLFASILIRERDEIKCFRKYYLEE